VLAGDFSMLRAEDEFERRLTKRTKLPQAFVCANDQMAIGALHSLARHNNVVPQDIIVTGFDDSALARSIEGGLTTVRQSASGLGEIAVTSLAGLFDGTVEKFSLITLPTNVVVRGSCGCASGANA
jgi:LacI family transcriptional regulator